MTSFLSVVHYSLSFSLKSYQENYDAMPLTTYDSLYKCVRGKSILVLINLK